MKTYSTTASLLIVLAVGTAALAQTPAAKPKPPTTVAPRIDFVTVDKDANGSLSKEETKGIADLETAFAQLDADHDEALTPAEFSRWGRAGKLTGVPRPDPATAPSGSAGAQHMPDPN